MNEAETLPGRENTVPVDGGHRSIAYRDFGPPNGPVVLYFHGIPSSSLDVHMFRGPDLASTLGVRLIALDRPGCGGSTFQARRTLLDWPGDVRDLTARLGIRRVSVLGWSGGAPYALACARQLPTLVRSCAVVSSVAPLRLPGYTTGMSKQSRTFFRLNRSAPPLGRLLDALMLLGARKDPAQFLRRSAAALPPVDRSALESAAVGSAYLAAVTDCFRSGLRGGRRDAALAARRWPFELDEIGVPVHIWHGARDTDAPEEAARWLHRSIPTATLHLLAEDGHISLITTHLTTILADLVSTAERAD